MHEIIISQFWLKWGKIGKHWGDETNTLSVMWGFQSDLKLRRDDFGCHWRTVKGEKLRGIEIQRGGREVEVSQSKEIEREGGGKWKEERWYWFKLRVFYVFSF